MNPDYYIVQGGPNGNGGLSGHIRQASNKGWYYDFSQAKQADWLNKHRTKTEPVNIICKKSFSDNQNTLDNLNKIVESLNNKLSNSKYSYEKGPNSNTYVKMILESLGVSTVLPSSDMQIIGWK
jgi:hypothetical protein